MKKIKKLKRESDFNNNKNKMKLLWIFLGLFVVTIILIFLYPYMKGFSSETWTAIAAIGQVLGALATTAAVIIVLLPKKPKIDLDFKIEDANENEQHVAKIYIFNTSEIIAIIHALRISLDKTPESDLVKESFNSLRDGFRDYRDPISILPYQKEIIELNPSAMLWGLGHTIDKPNENTKNRLIKITIIVNDKKFIFSTKYTFEQYYNAFTHND